MALLKNPTLSTGGRLQSIDMLRGLIMVLMALDHVRDYFSVATFDPLDFTQTNVPFFLTRWITHYCAPTFIFLAGISAYLYRQHIQTDKQLFNFLITRGIWMLILEFTFVRLGWFYNFDYSFIIGQVIWAIGWSMIALSFLIFLPWKVVGIIGISIIIFHNLLDPVTPQYFGTMDWIWKIFHEGGPILLSKGVFYIAYPIFPWIGVMVTGFAFGSFFSGEQNQRIRSFTILGFGIIAAFIIIRFSNLYGDASHWQTQKNTVFTILSFVNCTKYPPSLLYILMTLGPAILLLAWFEKLKGWLADFFITIGKVPLFYYLCHIFLIHALILLDAYVHGFNTDYLFSNVAPWGTKERYGYGLLGVYTAWIIVVALLYPLCRWYAAFKQKRKDLWWLSYL